MGLQRLIGVAAVALALLIVTALGAAATPYSQLPTAPPSLDATAPPSPAPTSTPATSPTSSVAAQPSTSPAPSAEDTLTAFPEPLPPPPPGLDAATRRAIELEGLIEELRGEQAALQERVGTTNRLLSEHVSELEAAHRRLEQARATLGRRLVQVYKDGAFDPLSLLLGSRTFDDFIARFALFSRIAAYDDQLITEANLRAAEAEYGRYVLQDLQGQDAQLRAVLDERMHALRMAAAEQQAILTGLTDQSRSLVAARADIGRMSRKQWRAMSIPIGTVIRHVEATVAPYPELTYLVSEGQPRRYRSTGRRFAVTSSWYGPGFNGRLTASGQIFNQDDFTCASRTLPFGTRLALSNNGKRIIVVVNDRGPYIDGRDLDVSAAAALALGFSGVATIEAEQVIPLH